MSENHYHQVQFYLYFAYFHYYLQCFVFHLFCALLTVPVTVADAALKVFMSVSIVTYWVRFGFVMVVGSRYCCFCWIFGYTAQQLVQVHRHYQLLF